MRRQPPTVHPCSLRRVALGVMSSSLALTLFACTVGPDIATPDVSHRLPTVWSDLPTQTTDADADADAATQPQRSTQVDFAQWWMSFGDPELALLVHRSLADNLSLAQARLRVMEARARRGIQNAERLPQLDADAGYSYARTGDEGFSFTGVPAGQDADLYRLGVVAGWELDLWGRVGRLVEAADADIDVAVEDARAVRIALAAEVAREVIRVRTLDAEIVVVRDTIASDRDAYDLAQSRVDAGFANALDAQRALRVLKANQAILPTLLADRRASELTLSTLLGVPTDRFTIAQTVLPQGPPMPDMGMPAELLTRRPDLRRAEREFAAATARIGAAMAERYPRVTLSGRLSLQGPDLGDAVNPDAYVANLGPSLTLPILDGGRITSRTTQAQSQQQQALARLEQAVLDAVAEAQTAADRFARLNQRLNRLHDAQAAAQDTEALARDRFEAGRSDFLDVTEATTQRLQIELALVNAQGNRLLRLIDLYTALGGGWQTPR